MRDFYSGTNSFGSLTLAEMGQVEADYDAISWYRTTFSAPLLKVRMGLKSFARTCGFPDARLAQRHKRLARIMAKLHRFPAMNITTMQDIGGCRLVLPDLASVSAVRRHIEGQWGPQIVDQDDYVATPQPSGYRAIHIIVERDERMIEVQLRTTRQHRWADTVEALSRSAGSELKWGEDPRSVGPFLRAYADGLAELDAGRPLPDVVRAAIQQIFGPTDTV